MRRARIEAAEAEMLVVDSSKPEVTYVTFSFADALQADWLIRNAQITWNALRELKRIFLEIMEWVVNSHHQASFSC